MLVLLDQGPHLENHWCMQSFSGVSTCGELAEKLSCHEPSLSVSFNGCGEGPGTALRVILMSIRESENHGSVRLMCGPVWLVLKYCLDMGTTGGSG
jgi:hypothetical protein